MEIFHYALLNFLIICGFFVIFSNNPVHSVLFLVLIFLTVSCLLLILKIEFLSLLILIIYVGAIAVLFLFVVMMLNIKSYIHGSSFYLYRPFIFVLSLFLAIELFQNLTIIFSELFIYETTDNLLNNFSIIYFEKLNNIEIFGQSLYNNYIICFLLAGLILLLAMVGSIILTLVFKNQKKSQLYSKQLVKSDRSVSIGQQSRVTYEYIY